MKQLIKGFITDAQNGTPLKEVRVYTNSNLAHNLSNKKGKFSVEFDSANDEEILFSLPGYKTESISIASLKDSPVEISLYKKKGNVDKDDYELIQSALGGNQSAFGVLLERYRDSVNYVIYKMVSNTEDAEDLTMEAFGKAFNNLTKYRPDYAFSTWLFRIAINNTIDFIRKKRLQTLSLDSPIYGTNINGDEGITRTVHSGDLDPEELIIKDQRAELMRTVTGKLHDKYKELIVLRYFQEKSYDEIAEETNLPLGTVKAQLFRAKQLLSNVLKNSNGTF